MTGPARETRSERVLTNACRHCGEQFRPTRPHQAYCRPSCRRAAFTGRQTPRPLPFDSDDDLFRVPFE